MGDCMITVRASISKGLAPLILTVFADCLWAAEPAGVNGSMAAFSGYSRRHLDDTEPVAGADGVIESCFRRSVRVTIQRLSGYSDPIVWLFLTAF